MNLALQWLTTHHRKLVLQLGLSWLISMAWILVRRRAWSKLVISTVLVLCSAVVQADTKFSFPPAFPYQNNNSILEIAPGSDAVYMNGSFRMNVGAVTGGMALTNSSCARVLYKDKIRMMDKVTQRVASFNTSFTFSIESTFNDAFRWCGDGMVFSFHQINNISSLEQARSGGFCVHDFSVPHERQFSVEVDTYHNYGYDNVPNDFSDSHIGVNFGNEYVSSRHDLCNSTAGHCTTVFDLCSNTIVETNTRAVDPRSDCQNFCRNGSTSDYTLWIDYDGEGHTLEVRVTNESLPTGTQKPAQAVITVPNLRLNEFLKEGIEMYYVGFSAGTGWAREVHVLKSWEFVSTDIPNITDTTGIPNITNTTGTPDIPAAIGNSSIRNRIPLIAGVCAAAALTVILVFLWLVYKKRRTRPRPLKNQELVSSLGAIDGLRTFTYTEISSSTNNFSSSGFLSGGAFGDVYRGVLPSGDLVAVKRIKDNQGKGEESFLAEIKSLTQIRHRNLLQLRGWSHNHEELFLVYDYMSNGSLDKWIYQSETDLVLSWDERRFILAGVVAGLDYLHTGWVQCVLHRDIKASNVLLDADFIAYVGDFGLARLIDHHKLEKTTLLAGTLGYMAPEMHFTGKATKETDVYAFGILVLEVVCGRRPLNEQRTDHPADTRLLLDSVWRAQEAGNILNVADTRLLESQPDGETSDMLVGEMMIIANVLHLGLLCCLPNPSERPTMRQVNHWFQACELEGTMKLPSLPASRPYYQHISDVGANSQESSSSAATRGSSTSQSSGSSSVTALPTSTKSGSSVVAEKFGEPGR